MFIIYVWKHDCNKRNDMTSRDENKSWYESRCTYLLKVMREIAVKKRGKDYICLL